jgi:RHS repeat-associated protein
MALRYDLLGNILWKSDACPTSSPCYAYSPSRPHAVTKVGSASYGYDANGNMTGRDGAVIDWYSYNLPSALTGAAGSRSQFWYGPLRNRWKQVAIDAGSNETTVYVGGLLEKVTRDGSTTWRHYVPGPGGTIAIHLRFANGSPARTYHPLHDHLGGVDRIADGRTGRTLVAESFDPFGRRRGGDGGPEPSAADWTAIRSITRDGFAGHEHLDNLGLIHMNGRVYDPAIGRFLSADPIVQDPYDGQDLNRYSYAWNNPLAVIDPSGLEEVRCMHGPDGACQGVTVTGLRDRRDMDAASTYRFWLGSWSGQAASAAERDPCGQDGSAMACTQVAARTPRSLDAAAVPGADGRAYGTAVDYLQGLAASLGNLGMSSAPVFWLFPDTQEFQWFPVPETVLGDRGAALGELGYFFGGLAGTMRTVATGTVKRTIASAGGVVRQFEQPRQQVFYRVFSGDATVGSWLTAVPPRSQAWAQEALALPPWNKATHFQEVLVPEGTLMQRSRATGVPDWGRMRGGAEQFKLLETIPQSNFGPGRPLP